MKLNIQSDLIDGQNFYSKVTMEFLNACFTRSKVELSPKLMKVVEKTLKDNDRYKFTGSIFKFLVLENSQLKGYDYRISSNLKEIINPSSSSYYLSKFESSLPISNSRS